MFFHYFLKDKSYLIGCLERNFRRLVFYADIIFSSFFLENINKSIWTFYSLIKFRFLNNSQVSDSEFLTIFGEDLTQKPKRFVPLIGRKQEIWKITNSWT